jgi:hypothetical protein
MKCGRTACKREALPHLLNSGTGKTYCLKCARQIQESASRSGIVLFESLVEEEALMDLADGMEVYKEIQADIDEGGF